MVIGEGYMIGSNPKEWVRRVRGELTQDKLAELLGTNRETIAKWEGGTARPTYDFIYKLSQIEAATSSPSTGPGPVDGRAVAKGASERILLEKFRLLTSDQQFELISTLSDMAAEAKASEPAPKPAATKKNHS